MSLNIIAENALLNHINVRSQGNKSEDDDATVAMDADFICVMDNKILTSLFGSTEPMGLWEDSGAIKYPGLGQLPSKAKIKDAQMSFGDITVNNVKAKKFRITALSNKQVEIKLQCQFVPDEGQTVDILNALRQRAKLTVSATEQKDIFDDSK